LPRRTGEAWFITLFSLINDGISTGDLSTAWSERESARERAKDNGIRERGRGIRNKGEGDLCFAIPGSAIHVETTGTFEEPESL